MTETTYTYRLVDKPEPDIDAVGRLLDDYNSEIVGDANNQLLAVLVYDSDSQLLAGLSGYTAWGWLYIRWLWVREDHRGQGIASSLLERAEQEAQKRDCVGAHIDTFNPQAHRIYEHHGYREFGSIPNFVGGATRSFLKKRWA